MRNVKAASAWTARNKICIWRKCLLRWDHSARPSWPHAYLLGTPWLVFTQEDEGVPSAEELQSLKFHVQGKMWPPVPFSCKGCWAHFSSLSEGLWAILKWCSLLQPTVTFKDNEGASSVIFADLLLIATSYSCSHHTSHMQALWGDNIQRFLSTIAGALTNSRSLHSLSIKNMDTWICKWSSRNLGGCSQMHVDTFSLKLHCSPLDPFVNLAQCSLI